MRAHSHVEDLKTSRKRSHGAYEFEIAVSLTKVIFLRCSAVDCPVPRSFITFTAVTSPKTT